LLPAQAVEPAINRRDSEEYGPEDRSSVEALSVLAASNAEQELSVRQA